MRKYHISYIILIVILLTTLAINYTPRKGDTQILAVVDEKVITESDLDLYLESYKLGILEIIVDMRVMESMASDLDIEVTDQEIEEELEVYKSNIGVEQFNAMLKDNFSTEEGLKINLKENLLKNKLIEYYKGQIEVTDQEIEETYNNYKDKMYLVDVEQYSVTTGDNYNELIQRINSGESKDVIRDSMEVDIVTLTNVGADKGEFALELIKLDVGSTYEDSESLAVYKVVSKITDMNELKEHITSLLKEELKQTEFDNEFLKYKNSINIEYK